MRENVCEQNTVWRPLPTISCTILATCVEQNWTETERAAK